MRRRDRPHVVPDEDRSSRRLQQYQEQVIRVAHDRHFCRRTATSWQIEGGAPGRDDGIAVTLDRIDCGIHVTDGAFVSGGSSAWTISVSRH